MKGGNNVGGSCFKVHVFKGFLLLHHMLETFIGVHCGKQIINNISRHLGVGHPQSAILERRSIIVNPFVSTGRYRKFAEIGIGIIKSRGFSVSTQVQQADLVSLGSHNHGAAWKGGEQPEGIKLLVAECGSCVVISHCISFNLVPDAKMAKEEFTVGKRT